MDTAPPTIPPPPAAPGVVQAAAAAPATARLWAVVPCAGTGSRATVAAHAAPLAAGTPDTFAVFDRLSLGVVPPAAPLPVPKQYRVVAGLPVAVHTLLALRGVTRLAGTVVAVAPDDVFLDAWQDGSFLRVACGGATRAATVRNGLSALRELGADARDWVLVHDAARCLVTPKQIDRLIDACLPDGVGGLLAQRLADTLKTAVPGVAGLRVGATVERSDKWLAQTPQMFRLGLLDDALAQAGLGVTDEASAVEAMGLHPLIVEGSGHNLKITYPEDFELAQALLSLRVQDGTLDRFGGDRGEAAQVPGKPLF